MIVVRSLKDFLAFVDVVKAKNIPFHIVGSQDEGPSIFDYEEKLSRFRFRYALCCTLFTVYLSSSVDIEKKETVTGLFEKSDLTLFKKIGISNGMLECV